MPSGFSGNLISEQFASTLVEGISPPSPFRTHVGRWWRRRSESLGPASPARALFASAIDLLTALDFRSVSPLEIRHGIAVGEFVPGTTLLAHPWGESADSRWRQAVRLAVERNCAWCFCFNGLTLGLLDARRTYARRYVSFDLGAAVQDERSVALLWTLFHASAINTDGAAGSRLDAAIERSARETLAVCHNLEHGVLDALQGLMEGLLVASARRTRKRDRAADLDVDGMHAQALTLIYRLLFLLFAEARRLVPAWHPIYRDSYSLDALCSLMQTRADSPGIWDALQAIWRLAHAGCDTTDLHVTAFNGRLFSPREAPLADSVRVDDRYARRAVMALATAPPPSRGTNRTRVSYRDLGVEELGGVYEHVLDYSPALAGATTAPAIALRPGRLLRKATGTFYTPRSLTEFLVRRTLHPLVAEATPEQILRLRVLDPAMGSGAFLVSACRYLAGAYEEALVRSGSCAAPDLDERDRVAFRRVVAQRCLYGVDLNPMAVQLARLSMWLTTLAADRPLNFLDHRLICGDSLIGASPDDVMRQPPGTPPARSASLATLPLFDASALETAVQQVVPIRLRLASEPDDTADTVRQKDRALVHLTRSESPWTRWLRLADLWCAIWLWEGPSRPDRRTYLELAHVVSGGVSSLPATLTRRLIDQANVIAGRTRFCHWPLQFPEVFFESDGGRRADAGFDAVLGNPPWEMLRADGDDADSGRESARARLAGVMRFIRSSGVYREHQDGQPNQYQLFVERAMQLARPGGRVGLVLPWGLASDAGSAPLRRLLLQRSATDTLIAFDNTDAIFPIHRSVRFVLLAATKTAPDRAVVPCRFGEREPSALDNLADDPMEQAASDAIPLSVALLEKVSGHDLTIPYLRNRADLGLLEDLHARHPTLEHASGWGVEFGRELNATDDRDHFVRRAGRTTDDVLPVLDGKHIEPFVVDPGRSSRAIRTADAARIVDPRRSFQRARLAYRDVASATNRLTLIAAVVPAGCLTTHTLFCLRTALRRDEQEVLCGLLNSFVANYLVRLRVSSHVTVGIMRRLPAPRPQRDSGDFIELAEISRRLAAGPGGDGLFDDLDYIRLQCVAANLYGLTRSEFEYVLGTFPLIPAPSRTRTLYAYHKA